MYSTYEKSAVQTGKEMVPWLEWKHTSLTSVAQMARSVHLETLVYGIVGLEGRGIG